jgi:hypothetical protein
MADETIRQETISLLPEYQERFLKDLLSNIYRVDPTTGQPAGIAATSPLYGTPVVDAEGKPVYELDAQGQPRLDIRGQPIQKVEGGVPRPEIMPFTDAQRRAIEMGVQGIGAYAPMLRAAEGTLGQGVSSLSGTMGAYDPQSYRAFYDPFVEQVVSSSERDIQRQADIERNRINAGAVSAGAFGGSRQAVAEQELQRNTADQMARTGAQLRSAAYTGAQQQAQNVFEALEQAQRQGEYDVQRAGAIEAAYEPFQRFSYMSDIFRGVPSTQQTLGVTSVPTPSPISSVIGTAMGLGAYGSQYGGLGSLLKPSGG